VPNGGDTSQTAKGETVSHLTKQGVPGPRCRLEPDHLLLSPSLSARLRATRVDGNARRLGKGKWPAADFVDTEIGCFMKPEVANATTEVRT
jgi:hypothetical protein